MSRPNPEAVRATFESVAPRYDLANHFLSGGIDFYWRRQLVKMANQYLTEENMIKVVKLPEKYKEGDLAQEIKKN